MEWTVDYSEAELRVLARMDIEKKLTYAEAYGAGPYKLGEIMEQEALKMGALRKAVKKTLIDSDINKKVLHALTGVAPGDIVKYMAKDCPRTLVDIINRMEGSTMVAPAGASVITSDDFEEHEVPAPPPPPTDWAHIKKVIEEIYMGGDTTEEELAETVMVMGECDEDKAHEIVQEMFDEI